MDAGRQLETQGVSPKAKAAGAGAVAAPLIARLLAEVFGLDVDSEAVEGLILAGLAGVGAAAAAWKARPGRVVVGPARR